VRNIKVFNHIAAIANDAARGYADAGNEIRPATNHCPVSYAGHILPLFHPGPSMINMLGMRRHDAGGDECTIIDNHRLRYAGTCPDPDVVANQGYPGCLAMIGDFDIIQDASSGFQMDAMPQADIVSDNDIRVNNALQTVLESLATLEILGDPRSCRFIIVILVRANLESLLSWAVGSYSTRIPLP
jgi:hypothetical protein